MNTFKTFRAGLMAMALLTLSSSAAAFGQLQVPVEPNSDNPAKNAVTFTLVCGNAGCVSSNYAVPKGHRLVVTFVSTSFHGSTPTVFYLAGTLNGAAYSHGFLADTRFETQHGLRWGRTHSCFVVVDAILLANSTVGSSGGSVTVSGYLVKM